MADRLESSDLDPDYSFWDIDQSHAVSLVFVHEIRDPRLLLIVLLLSLTVFLTIRLLLLVSLTIRAQLLMLSVVLLWGLLAALIVISLGLGLGLVVIATILRLEVLVRHLVRVGKFDVELDALKVNLDF